MGLLSGLHVTANNGVKVKLYQGGTIQVRAMSFKALERLDQEFPSWLGRVLSQLEKGIAISPAGLDSQTEALLRDMQLALPDWREAVLFIVQDSNPDRGITLDWLRDNLYARDIPLILKAWVGENALTELLEAVQKKVVARLRLVTEKRSAAS